MAKKRRFPVVAEQNIQQREPKRRPKQQMIKFKNSDLQYLRDRLLDDLSREHFAVLLGKTEIMDQTTIVKVIDMRFPVTSDYNNQSIAFLGIKKDFVYQVLVELKNRYDVDTIIDVHTHPFTKTRVAFSGTDNQDERTFHQFLNRHFDDIHYASIVLSQEEYSARIWTLEKHASVPLAARLKTQTMSEAINSSDLPISSDSWHEQQVMKQTNGLFHRGTLALGLPVMRQIMSDQVISIIGVGGLGSVIAEHLIHMGFHHINLIDPDILEISNLNRVVGAYYDDAEHHAYKVDVVKRHLIKINPQAEVHAYRHDVYDQVVEQELALSDWLLLATDNHSSRFKAQQISMKYFVPLISAGVNITVEDSTITDMSGEVITIRVGDCLCLNCLSRINPTKVANETHPDQEIREELVKRGYVSGKEVKEPAVKTLNTTVATMAVDALIDQYTGLHEHVPIQVYEKNKYTVIYEDMESVRIRNKHCFICNI